MDGQGPVRSVLVRFGWLPALLVPAWFSGARLLTDSAGTLSLVLALTAAPALVITSLLTLWLPPRRRHHQTGAPVLPSPRAAVLISASWALGLVFGLTVPDLGDGAASVLTVLLGEQREGLSAAVSNPAGILMVFCAAMALGLALVDARRDALGPPEPIDDEAVLRAYGYSFMDDPVGRSR